MQNSSHVHTDVLQGSLTPNCVSFYGQRKWEGMGRSKKEWDVRVTKREREWERVRVCVRERERDRVSVCVCVKERETELQKIVKMRGKGR